MGEAAGLSRGWRWLGPVLVLLLAGWLFRALDWKAVAEGFRSVNPWLLPVLIGLLALNFVIRSWRWGMLLPDGGKLPWRSLLDATVIGFTANFLLPFRAGELARPWVLSRWEAVPFGSALASIVVERILDALVVVGFLAVSLSGLKEAPDWLAQGAMLLGGIALGGILVMLAAYSFSDHFGAFSRRILALVFRGRWQGIGTKLNHGVVGFIAGMKAIGSFRELLLVLGASVLLWLEMALFYQVGLWALGHQLPVTAGMTVMVLVALAVAAPGPPAFFGTFQIGCVAALGLYGIGREEALGYSIVMHVLQALCIVGAGMWVLRSRGIGLKEALPGAERDQAEPG